MAGYKDTEIEAAVSRFVKSAIRIEKDALGPVDMGSKFDEVLQLFSSTLTYDPNAIFYVIYLATNKLNAVVETALEYIEDMYEAIGELGYHTEDVTRTTLLGDAAAALLTVDQILTDKSVISSKAFTRYQQAVDAFIRYSIEPNIKQSGQVVRPPQLARQSIFSTISNLSTTYEDILSTLEQISAMLEEFNSLNLGVLSVQSSVQKVRDDLRSLQSQFESVSMTRDDKIALCREAYLSMASGKAVLNNYTTVVDPLDPRLLSSSSVSGETATPSGDEGELVPATVTGTRSGPWEIAAAENQLKVAADAGTETTYTFTPPAQPSVTSFYHDNFDENIEFPVAYHIESGAVDLLEIDALPTVTLTPGVSRTAEQIVEDINDWADAGSYPYEASVLEEVLPGPITLSYVKITKTVPGAVEIRMTAEAAGSRENVLATYAAIGFYEGQSDTSKGLSAVEAAQQINEVGEITAEVVKTLYDSGDSTGVILTLTSMTLDSDTIEDTDHAGDMLLIRSGINAGYHRIVSVTRGAVDTVNVDSLTPFKKTGVSESWIILSETLKLTSIAEDLTTSLAIGDGNVNDLVGFTDDTTAGTTTGFKAKEDGTYIDFSHIDIVEGDVVRVAHLSDIGTVSSEHEVLELSSSGYQLELYPSLGTDWTLSSFRILSAAAVAYEDFIDDLDGWYSWLDVTDFSSDIMELERVINPLLANKNPSSAQLNDARNTLLSLKNLLTYQSPYGLTEVLMGFQVMAVSRIDAALKMLKERGLDRAYDLLMDGKIEEFFAMDKDDASSSAYMLKSMRGVVRSDLRVSKFDEDADDTVLRGVVVGTDPDYDYSDADKDENIRLLGETADFDSELDAGRTSRARY